MIDEKQKLLELQNNDDTTITAMQAMAGLSLCRKISFTERVTAFLMQYSIP